MLDYTCAMVLVGSVALILVVWAVFSHLMHGMGHDNPEVLKALKHDRMASYRPAHVVRVAAEDALDAGTAFESTRNAWILRAYVVPKRDAQAIVADTVATARAAGWRIGTVPAIRPSALAGSTRGAGGAGSSQEVGSTGSSGSAQGAGSGGTAQDAGNARDGTQPHGRPVASTPASSPLDPLDAVVWQVGGEKHRADGSVASLTIELEQDDEYTKYDIPAPPPISSDQIVVSVSLDSGRSGEGGPTAVLPPSTPAP